ncbi:hypothetical protein C8Q72DRAFT_890366 [Fomitopsis betulina]|nr:hypothetical protein C8Q72DRAFT_890366 [Fomitopsis betulina]
MDHFLRFQVAHQRSSQIPPRYEYPHTIPYQSVMSTQSYLRSSAPHSLPYPIPHAQSFSQDSPVSSYSSSGFQTGSPTGDAPFAYSMEGTEFDSVTVPHQRFYPGGEHAHESMWSLQERSVHNDFYGDGSFPPEAVPIIDEAQRLLNRYLKQEESNVSLNEMSTSYFAPGATDSSSIPYAPPQGNDSATMAAAFGYGFDHSVQPQHYANGSPSFALASDPNLPYPPSTESVPRFISPAQIAPGMSPTATLFTMDGNETTGLDPRYTVGSPALLSESPASNSQESIPGLAVFPRASPGSDGALSFPNGRPQKRRRTVSFTSSSSSGDYPDGDSERDTDEVMDDYDDEDYIQDGMTDTRRRTVSSTSSSSRQDSSLRRVVHPIPVPNLTKKSRGRRVPTVASVLIEDQAEKARRTYMCEVNGCGKCFARGEHLKRHVRSIHTNEKPHKCPFPGCGKDFSRHDNLGQHMRVHKNWPTKQRRLAGPA